MVYFRFVLLMAFVVGVGLSAFAQDLSPYLCDVNLSVHAPSDAPVEFPWALFTETPGDSLGKLQLVNKSEKTIQHFVIVMELLDSNAEYLFSVPVFNMEEDQRIPFDISFKSWLLASWTGHHSGPIPPTSAYGATFSSALTALSCPVSAMISMIQLRYADGSRYEYISPTMNISTAPAGAIKIADEKAVQRWGPLATSGTIAVDSQGHLKVIHVDFASDRFGRWLEKEVVGWRFTVPWSGGKPAPTQMPFLLILGDSTDARVQIETMKRRGLHGAILVLHFAGGSS